MLNLPVADPVASATTPGAGSSGFTAGSVVFADAGGALNQDNANLFWDDALNYLGIGTLAPSSPLHVAGSISPAANATAAVVTIAGTIVENAAGVHARLTGLSITAPTVTAGAGTVTDTATVYISGPMTAAVAGTNYALWVDSGIAQFDGNGSISIQATAVIQTNASAANAFYASGGGVQVSNTYGYDGLSATAIPIGKTTATGVALSKVGGASTLLGTMTHTYSAIGTAATVVHSIVNTTAAAAGAQQYSGVFELGGKGWETNVGSSMTVKWGLQARPVQGAAAPTSILDIFESINGAAYPAGGFLRIGTTNGATGARELYVNGAVQSVDTHQSLRNDIYAFYGSGAASGVIVGSGGYDVHTAGLVYVGKTTATGVQIGPGAVGTTGTPTTALITQAIHTGGAATIFKVTGAAIVGQDASTESADVVWDLSRTVTIKTGALTLQRQVVFDVQTTLAFVGASVVATAVGMHISAGPTKGGNAEITSTVGVYIGGVGATGAAATTTVVSAAGARFAQMLFSNDTVSFLGGTGVTANNAPISAVSLGQLTVTGDTATCTVANAATLYINGAPIAGQNVALTKTYSIFVDAGLCRFDGDGTRVFEFPADATGNASAATGRIPILIGAATQYLRYYAD